MSTGQARQQGNNRETDKRRGGAWGCVCVWEREREREREEWGKCVWTDRQVGLRTSKTTKRQ